MGKADIIIDGELPDDDEEADAKAEEEPPLFGNTADTSEGQSNLVQQIEEENKASNGEEAKEDAKGQGIRFGRKIGAGKSKAAQGGMSMWSESDIKSLREAVQKLCTSTNPLGKCMDYVHEDLSAMSKELDRWQHEYRQKTEDLEKERKITEEALEPLKLQKLDIDEQIKDTISKINVLKSKISKNDEQIETILQGVVQL